MSDSDKESAAASTSGNNNKVERLAKHLRRRYWTSWEEMKLVECWRRHSEEMTSTMRNQPAHCAISGEMKMHGFHVNSQECRRKIHSLINKYNTERRAIEKSDNKAGTSDWRLYRLIDCVLHPIKTHKDINHETNIVKQLLDKLPATQTTTDQRQPCQSVKIDAKRACRPVGRPPSKFINKLENGFTQQQPVTATPLQTTAITEQLPQNAAAINNSSPVVPPVSVNVRKRNRWRSTATVQNTKAANGAIDFRLHRFKIPRLEDLKADNIRLAERRDMALRNLYAQEREVQMFQTLVQGLQCRGK